MAERADRVAEEPTVPLPSPQALEDARAAKRTATDRRALVEAKHLILRYRGLMAEQKLDVPPALDREAFAWLQQQVQERTD